MKTIKLMCAMLMAAGLSLYSGLMHAADVASDNTATATASTGRVARAVLTSGISNREPMDELTSVTTAMPQVYYYTDLRGFEGQTVTHRWERDNVVMGEVKSEVKTPRWRTWSSKTLLPEWTGKWRVTLLDGQGNDLHHIDFDFTKATQ